MVVDGGRVVVDSGTVVVGAVVTGTVGAWVVEGASGCPPMVVIEVGVPISGTVVMGVSVTTVVVVVESNVIGPGSVGSSAVVTVEGLGEEGDGAVVSGTEVVAVVVDAIGPRGWPTVTSAPEVVVAAEVSETLLASTSTAGASGCEI